MNVRLPDCGDGEEEKLEREYEALRAETLKNFEETELDRMILKSVIAEFRKAVNEKKREMKRIDNIKFQ